MSSDIVILDDVFDKDLFPNIQSDLISIGIATITDGSGGGSISTVRSTNPLFPGEIRSGNLVKYTNTSGGTDDPSYAKVVSVGSSEITIEAVTTVAAVNDGSLPGANLTANDYIAELMVWYSNLVLDGSRYGNRTNQNKFLRGWINRVLNNIKSFS